MRIFDFIDNPFEKKKEWFEIREGQNLDSGKGNKVQKVYNVLEMCNKGYFRNVKTRYAGNFETLQEAEVFIETIKNQEFSKTIKKIY